MWTVPVSGMGSSGKLNLIANGVERWGNKNKVIVDHFSQCFTVICGFIFEALNFKLNLEFSVKFTIPF